MTTNAPATPRTITLHTGTPAESTWTIAATLHTRCARCVDNAETAAIHASVTGSRGATWAPESRRADGTLVERHSVTVERVTTTD